MMKHSEIERLITENRPPGSAEQAHLANCESCRSLMGLLSVEVDDCPSSDELRSILVAVPTLSPVKPLPSTTTLTLLTVGVFFVFTLLAGLAVGLEGFHHLSILHRVLYYSGFLVSGILFSVSAVQVAIPGSRVIVPRPLAIGGSCLGIALLVAVMFRNFAVARFFEDGIRCFLLGSGCAILYAAIAGVLLRMAYVTDFRTTSVLIGSFAGFSGVAVLSLHCPLPNATHIVVWHLGVVAVSAGAGLLLSFALRYFRSGYLR